MKTYKLPAITQQQKDALVIYDTILSQSASNLFTANKFYQWFVKQELFCDEHSFFAKFKSGRFTPEYIYCRLLDLYALNLCSLVIRKAGIIDEEQELDSHNLYISKFEHENGIIPLLVDKQGLVKSKFKQQEIFIPIVPYDYEIDSKNLKTVTDIDKALLVVGFKFKKVDLKLWEKRKEKEEKEKNQRSQSKPSASSQPIIININNKTNKLHRISLFSNSPVPDGIELTSGIPGVSFQDVISGVKNEKNYIDKITVLMSDNYKCAAHETFYILYKLSDMTGNISTRLLGVGQQDFQNQKKIFTRDIELYPLNNQTILDLEINANDWVEIKLYLKPDAK